SAGRLGGRSGLPALGLGRFFRAFGFGGRGIDWRRCRRWRGLGRRLGRNQLLFERPRAVLLQPRRKSLHGPLEASRKWFVARLGSELDPGRAGRLYLDGELTPVRVWPLRCRLFDRLAQQGLPRAPELTRLRGRVGIAL